MLKSIIDKYFLYQIFLIVSIVGNSTRLKAQDTIHLSLQDAINLALQNNSDVAISEYQTNSTEYSFNEAKGNFLPKVTLNGNYSRNIDKPVIFLPEGFGVGGATRIGSDNNFTTSLDLSVPLYSKSNAANKNYANSNFHFQREALRGMRQSVIINVKKNYFTYLVTIAVLRVREKALKNAHENHNSIQNKLSQGVATEFDETTAMVKIATTRNNLLEAQSHVIPAGNNLKLILGLAMDAEIKLSDSLTLTNEELTASKETGDLLFNSNLKQKEIKVTVAKQQTSLVKAGYFPTISATGSYQFQSQQNDFNFSQYNWVKTSFLGLRLQFPLFNGMVTHNKVQQAIVAERMAEIQREYTSRANRSQLAQLLSELSYIRQRIELQSDNIEMAAKALSQVKERYNYGKGTFLEVNNAELEYISAQLNYLQAVMDYKSAYYDFELLTGNEN